MPKISVKYFQHFVKCKFCSKVLGEIRIEERHVPPGMIVDDKYCSIQDARCEDCEKIHGAFKDEQAKQLNP